MNDINSHTKINHGTYSDLVVDSYEKSERPGVLATLKGRFSTSTEESRNGNRYTPELWRDVVQAERVQEMLATKTFFGELSHPPREAEFLSEVQMNNVSHNITDLTYDESTGEMIGTLDILDTPSGRIADTFLRYGSKLGISSRGVSFDDAPDGVMTPDNYYLVTFDLVALPGIRGARLDPVTESYSPQRAKAKLNDSKLDFNKAITEAVKIRDGDALKVFKACLESTNLSNKDEMSKLIDSELVKLEDDVTNDVVEKSSEQIDPKPEDSDDKDKKPDADDLNDESESSLRDKLDGTEPVLETTEVSNVAGPVNGLNMMISINDEDRERVISTLEGLYEMNDTDDVMTITVDADQVSKLLPILNPDKVEDVEVVNADTDDTSPTDTEVEITTTDPEAVVEPEVVDTTEVTTDEELSDEDKSDLYELSKIVSELKQEVKDLSDMKDREIEDLNDQLQVALNESAKLRDELDHKESRIKVMRESYTKLELSKNDKIAELASKNRELRNRAMSSTNESARLVSNMKSKDAQISKLTTKVESLRTRLESVQSQLDHETGLVQSGLSARKSRLQKLVESAGVLRLSSDEIEQDDPECSTMTTIVDKVVSKNRN